MTESDEDLAQRARNGEAAAFHALLRRHYGLIYRLAYRLLGQAADADDVAQDVCAGLAAKIATFRGGSRFTTWLYAVTLNAVRDHGRRQRTIARLQGSYAAFAESAAADWADSEDRVRWLYHQIASLGGALQETALLVLAEDLSHAEAARALGVKEGTVSWRMLEVKKQLKAMARHD